MDTPSKRRPAAKSAQSTKPVPAASGPSAKPFLRFYHSDALRKKTLAMLTTLESARDPTVHRGALAGIAVELTNGGLDYFFLQPLKVAKAGFVVEQSASLGMTGVQQLMGSVIRNVVGRCFTRRDGRSIACTDRSARRWYHSVNGLRKLRA